MVELFALNVAKHHDLIKSEPSRNAVSPERLEKSKKFRNESDFLLSMGGELLARAAIKASLLNLGEPEIKNGDISFGIDRKGKSYINKFEYLHFNVSHSGDIVICALSMKEIGADCELISEDNGIEETRMVFSAGELAAIEPLSGRARLEKFHEMWVLKESFVKYSGEGVVGDLAEIQIIEKNGAFSATRKGKRIDCVFRLYDIGPEYKAAVCSEEKYFKPDAKFVDDKFIESIF